MKFPLPFISQILCTNAIHMNSEHHLKISAANIHFDATRSNFCEISSILTFSLTNVNIHVNLQWQWVRLHRLSLGSFFTLFLIQKKPLARKNYSDRYMSFWHLCQNLTFLTGVVVIIAVVSTTLQGVIFVPNCGEFTWNFAVVSVKCHGKLNGEGQWRFTPECNASNYIDKGFLGRH